MRTSLFITLAALSFVACKDEGTDADTSGSDDTDTGVDTDTDTADTDTADTDTADTGDTGAECWVAWDEGTCWDCDLPTSAESDSLKFYNQCSNASYVKFDNATRIPSSTWVPGTDLPPV